MNGRFVKGQRVQATKESVRNGAVKMLPLYGTVASTARKERLVFVRLDGNKSARYWSQQYWEPVSTVVAD